MHSKLMAMEERIATADMRTAHARSDCEAAAAELQAAQTEMRRLVESNERLKGAMQAEVEWSSKLGRFEMVGLTIGAVTQEARSHATQILVLDAALCDSHARTRRWRTPWREIAPCQRRRSSTPPETQLLSHRCHRSRAQSRKNLLRSARRCRGTILLTLRLAQILQLCRKLE